MPTLRVCVCTCVCALPKMPAATLSALTPAALSALVGNLQQSCMIDERICVAKQSIVGAEEAVLLNREHDIKG